MSTTETHTYTTIKYNVPEFLHMLGINPKKNQLHAAHPVSEGGEVVRVQIVVEETG